MPLPNPLKQLRRLDNSSPKFHDQLSNILYGEDYKQCVPNLQGDNLVWLVDYLDKALNDLDPSSPASRKCLRELRSICGTSAILPTSYTLSYHLLNVCPEPSASGGYGDVYKGALDGSRVCIKRVRVYTKDDPKRATKAFCQEAVMWKRLTHPNVLPLLGVTIFPLQLISIWMSGGDLPEYIEKYPNADRLRLLSDAAGGLCYLHSCNVIHGDLKGPNVLVDNSGQARIADFGLATVTQNLDSMRTASCQHGHTPRWTAPEVLNGGKSSKETDIFSFAMVMIEVFTGAVPFSNGSSTMAMLAITQGRRPPRPTHPTFTASLWTLTKRCWDQDPHSRPEVSEALQVLLNPEQPAWKRLINHTLSTRERISLVTAIFSDHHEVGMVRNLCGDNAQTFIDVIDEVLDSLEPQTRRMCLRSLYRICGRQALVPRSLEIPLCYDPMKNPLSHDGFADVWKGQHHGREVAAKDLRVYSKNDFGRIRRRFCSKVVVWKALHHPNVLPLLGVTMTETRFVMVSEWMEKGNVNEFAKANIKADRLGLLRDVTRGLIFVHDQGIIHGNLEGANVLIDNNGRARLAGPSLFAIASDKSTITPPAIVGDRIRWMSPELLDFGSKESSPTKESDCYALGMVIYEVLSGQIPFAPCGNLVIILKVLGGERPRRPQGDEGRLFTDDIWGILKHCWKPQPHDRISAKAVLMGLEGNSPLLGPSSNEGGDLKTDTDNYQPDATASRPRPPLVRGDDGLQNPSLADRLARSAGGMFKATTRKLCGLRQARR